MADLMKSKNTDFSSLERKYRQFHVPAMKIFAEGRNLLSGTGFAVGEISVTQDLRMPGSCQFSLLNVYDSIARKFVPDVKSRLKLGMLLEVELGYGSELSKVFYGYVYNIEYRFFDVPEIRVTAMDVRRMMMEVNSLQSRSGQKSSEIFQKIMDPYKKLYKKKTVDATDDDLSKDKIVTQYMNDFDFVNNYLTRHGTREFFVLNDTLYFRKPRSVDAPITELVWGSSPMSFSKSSTYLYDNLQVIGKTETDDAVVSAKQVVKSSDPQNIVVSSPGPVFLPDPSVTDAKKAKTRLQVEEQQRMAQKKQGTITSVGLPELVPGRFIKVSKLDPQIDGKYYIVRAMHRFDSEGYRTDLTLEG